MTKAGLCVYVCVCVCVCVCVLFYGFIRVSCGDERGRKPVQITGVRICCTFFLFLAGPPVLGHPESCITGARTRSQRPCLAVQKGTTKI